LRRPERQPLKGTFEANGEVKMKVSYPDHGWSYDFVEDQQERGGMLRILNIMEVFTRPSQCTSTPMFIKLCILDRNIYPRDNLQLFLYKITEFCRLWRQTIVCVI
jgi:hypothetical protein